MRIAIIHNQFSDGGGMEAYMQCLIQGFLSAKDEIHIHSYQVDERFAAKFDCQVHRKKLFYFPRRWKKYVFLKECNEHFDRKDYDLSLALTRTFAPDIAIVGGVHPASIHAGTGYRHILKRFHDAMETRFERSMLDRVPHIVAHSKSIADDIVKYYSDIDSSRLSVVYPPVDTDFFKKTDQREEAIIRKEHRIDTAKMTLLFPSTGHKRKGLPELLQAFRELDYRHYELLVTGEGLRSFSDIPENVRYLGYIENLSSLYSLVDYTILPSHYEPFGLAVIESLECGTPVIVTNSVGAAELLGEREAVILDNNQPGTLLSAILTLDKKKVEPGFVKRHALDITSHIKRLKNLVS